MSLAQEPAGAVQREWDVIVIGTGSGGKIAAHELARQGRSVLAVEAGRFGGDCPHVACVPAKSLLASAHAGLSWAEAVARRDELADGRDDSASRDSLSSVSVSTVRGRGQLLTRDSGRWGVRVTDGSGAEAVYAAGVVVLATGSTPSVPPLEGMSGAAYWTSDVALIGVSDRPQARTVRVEVTDRAGPGTPQLRPADRDAESGRGLELVEGLAARWGWRRRGSRMVTWFEIRDGCLSGLLGKRPRAMFNPVWLAAWTRQSSTRAGCCCTPAGLSLRSLAADGGARRCCCSRPEPAD